MLFFMCQSCYLLELLILGPYYDDYYSPPPRRETPRKECDLKGNCHKERH